MVTAAVVAGITGWGATASYIAAIVINLAIASILGKILAPDVPKDGRDTKALQTIVRDNVLPRRVGYGEFVTGGPYLALETFGTDNEEWAFIVALTGHPIEDVLGVFIEDVYVDISGNTSGSSNLDNNDLSSDYYVDRTKFGSSVSSDERYQMIQIVKNLGWGYADFNYVTDGNSTKASNDRQRAFKIRDMFVNPSYWDPPAATIRDSSTGLYTLGGAKVTNCAHIAMKLRYEQDIWSGYPQIKFHCKGKQLYNPAKDGTRVAQGADTGGTHRLDDPDTWEWSDDWTLCVLDYLLNTDYGLAAKTTGNLTEIDWEEAIQSYRDSSGDLITGLPSPDNTLEARYTINGIFETSSTPISTMEALLTSGAGELVYAQGKYKIRPGIYREPNSPNDIINEDMIVGPLAIQTHAPRSQIFNKAAGVYVVRGSDTNPRFEPHDFPIVDPLDSSGVNPYEVEDGEEIIREFDYPFTIHSYEAQRLARIQLERVRRGFAVSFNATLEVLKYSVGDTVYLEILNDSKYANEAFYNKLGLDDQVQDRPDSPFTPYYKQFKITDMQYNEDFTIAVTMIEESEDIYDWNDGFANPSDDAPESDLQITDPTGTILKPNWNLLSPAIPIDEVQTEGGTLTLVKWNAPERSSPIDFSELDKASVVSYYLEYGIVDNPSDPDPASRVTNWIKGGSYIVTNRDLPVQGPIGLKNIYTNVGDVFDFRVKATHYSGRSSAFAYFSVDTGADFDPTVPLNLAQYYILPTFGTTIRNSVGTLTLETRSITGLGDNLVTSGDVKLYEAESPYNEITVANGYAAGSDGYTGVFDAGDINGNKVIVISDGPMPSGTILDSVNLQDITDGATGATGQAVRTVNMYNKNDNSVASPTGGDFDTPIDSANAADGWTLNVPDLTANNDTAYVSTRTFTDDGQSPQDPSWSTPTIYSQRIDGGDGIAIRTVNMYNLNDNTVAAPSGGDFNTPIDSANAADGWTLGVPALAANNDIVYVTTRTFTQDGSSPQDASWSTPSVYATRIDGTPGIPGEPGEPGQQGPVGDSVRTVNMYNLNDNTVADTTGGTFNTPISSTNSSDGWSLNVPDLTADGDIVYVSTRTFSNTGSAPQDPTWSTPNIFSRRTDGVDGGAGQAVRTVNMYNLNDPTVAAPSGGDFNTPIDSANAADGWSLNVPALTTDGDIVYVTNRTFTDNAASPQDPSWATPTVYSQRTDGATGATGQSVRTVNMYNLNDNTVAAASGGDFNTPIDSANAADGWSLDVPSLATDGDIVYVSVRTFTDDAQSPQDPSWSTPTIYAQRNDGTDGAAGATGINSATVNLYNKNTSSSTPPAAFSGTFTYTFATGVLTDPSPATFNGWSQSAPSLSQGEYLWQRQAVASANTPTDSVDATEFNTAQIVGIGGSDGATGGQGDPGLNTATVYLFNKNTSGVTPPAAFSGTFTYTFSTGVLSASSPATLNGWSQDAPSLAQGEYLWLRQALASATTATDSVPTADFNTAQVVGIGGSDGATGATGAQGDPGLRTVQGYLYYEKTTAGAPAAPAGATYTFSTGLVSGTGINDAGTTNVWRNEPRPQDPTSGNDYYAIRYYGEEASPGGQTTITVSYSSAVIQTEFSGVVRFTGGTEIGDGTTTYDPAADVNANTTTIDGGKLTTGTVTAKYLEASVTTTGSLILGTNGEFYTSGKTAYGNVTAGIWMGWDAVSSPNAYKIDIGDDTNYLRWNSTALFLRGSVNITDGSILATGGINTDNPATSTDGRVHLQKGATPIEVYSDTNVRLMGIFNDAAGDYIYLERAKIADNTISDADFFTEAGITALQGRLGTTNPSNSTGGQVSLSAAKDIGDSSTTPEYTNATDAGDTGADSGTGVLGVMVHGSNDITLKTTISGSQTYSGAPSNQGWTAPQWTVTWEFQEWSGTAWGAWTAITGLSQTLTGTAYNEIEDDINGGCPLCCFTPDTLITMADNEEIS